MNALLLELQDQARQLFNCRCVLHGEYSETVHEIVPRSHGKCAVSLDNMVVLCPEGHDWAHRVGSKVSGPILVEARKRVLDGNQTNGPGIPLEKRERDFDADPDYGIY